MPRPLYRLAAAVGFLVSVLCAHDLPAQQARIEPVVIETGDLPIILSAPHGGRHEISGVSERDGIDVDRFRNKSDFNTDLLAKALADAIEKQLGKRPYCVIARFHRKYVDANRASRNAYESPRAKIPYDTYHGALEDAREAVMDRWGRGVLIDLHGQAANPKAIFRGTQNGNTTTHLVKRYGQQALIGDTSLFGQIAKQGLSVIPAVDSSDREHASYDGGYIVMTYGSRTRGTVDAIQLELGRELRSTKALPSTALKLANAITAFSDEYLPATEQASAPATRKQQEPRPIAVTDPNRATCADPIFSDDFADGEQLLKSMELAKTKDRAKPKSPKPKSQG